MNASIDECLFTQAFVQVVFRRLSRYRAGHSVENGEPNLMKRDLALQVKC